MAKEVLSKSALMEQELSRAVKRVEDAKASLRKAQVQERRLRVAYGRFLEEPPIAGLGILPELLPGA